MMLKMKKSYFEDTMQSEDMRTIIDIEWLKELNEHAEWVLAIDSKFSESHLFQKQMFIRT